MQGPTARVRGFTLLELLVVLTLAGLIVALVPPMFSAVMPALRLRTQVEEVATVLREARLEALRRAAITEVVFSEDSGYRGADGALRRLAAGVHLKGRGPAGFEGGGEDLAVFTVRFFPDGSSSGGLLALAGAGARYRVEVDWLMGRVEVTREQS